MFYRTRLQLTAWYLLIIMLISVAFSFVIFQMISIEIERFARFQRFRIERQLPDTGIPIQEIRHANSQPPALPDLDLINDAKERLVVTLMIVNGTILFFSGILGYFLAGITLRPIKTMLDEQNQFISDASHELRTPLTSLKSSIEVHLRDKTLNIKTAKKLLMDNLNDVDKLERLSNQLLELAQYQKPNGNSCVRPVSIKEAARDAIANVHAFAKQRGVYIRTRIGNDTVLGNIHEITDVCVILIENAIKYSAQKDTVTIASSAKNGWVTLTVSDKGLGIAKTDLPHVFDRFYRADSARSKADSDGYGLGLAIAKQIVTRLKGTIQCESSLGKGSVFQIRLPLVQKK